MHFSLNIFLDLFVAYTTIFGSLWDGSKFVGRLFKLPDHLVRQT